jgi:anti-sigma regulatory factor (Ser/Thr protein kinase)
MPRFLVVDDSKFVRNCITDEGRGFNTELVPDPTDPENFLKASGRGLLLIRSFMNEAYHNERGNEITLIKRSFNPPIAKAAIAEPCHCASDSWTAHRSTEMASA